MTWVGKEKNLNWTSDWTMKVLGELSWELNPEKKRTNNIRRPFIDNENNRNNLDLDPLIQFYCTKSSNHFK